jgi:anaerobic dimethyl sulfoxide reductase subunit B (iron-sulfur subunit)
MTKYGFYFDSSCCSGCKTCQVACKDKNDLTDGIRFRRVYEVCGSDWEKDSEGAWVPDIVAYNLSVACNHCENPSCVTACPTKAMHIGTDGIVLVDPKKCVGCRYCEWACPYGAPQYNSKKGIMQKCDFCADYIGEGKQPVCVTSCLMRALDFDTLENLEARYGTNRDVYPLPHSGLTSPAVIIKPHSGAEKGKELKASIINREEVRNDR